MYGAILGDIIGSPYEFDLGLKIKNFPIFNPHCTFTDDSVITLAFAEAFMDAMPYFPSQDSLVRNMRKYAELYPNAGYGIRFRQWLYSSNPQPYHSFGNGSAMRVSCVAWLFQDIQTVRAAARCSAEITHNHPEGIKGAEATASAIFLGRMGFSKQAIKDYIVTEFGYDLSRTCDDIRPTYHHVESCQQTVPEAITAFLEGESFEDVIRTAVSLGGDCDTLAAIAGSIAEGYYGVPEWLRQECRKRLPEDLLSILKRFEKHLN